MYFLANIFIDISTKSCLLLNIAREQTPSLLRLINKQSILILILKVPIVARTSKICQNVSFLTRRLLGWYSPFDVLNMYLFIDNNLFYGMINMIDGSLTIWQGVRPSMIQT